MLLVFGFAITYNEEYDGWKQTHPLIAPICFQTCLKSRVHVTIYFNQTSSDIYSSVLQRTRAQHASASHSTFLYLPEIWALSSNPHVYNRPRFLLWEGVPVRCHWESAVIIRSGRNISFPAASWILFTELFCFQASPDQSHVFLHMFKICLIIS